MIFNPVAGCQFRPYRLGGGGKAGNGARPNRSPLAKPVQRVYNRIARPELASEGLTPVNPTAHATDLHATLLAAGVRAALIELNRASGYRFTALYRFDRSLARGLYFYDRDNPSVEAGDDYPVEASYCVYVRDGGVPFVVEDAPENATAGRTALGQVKAYCGVPVFDRDGHTFGSLCHFDLTPVPADAEGVALMETLAGLLARL